MGLPDPYYDDGKGIMIYCADCRDILPELPDGSVDLVLTDPPYGHNNNNGDLIHHREEALGHVKRGIAKAGDARPIANDDADSANELVRFVFAETARLLKPGACCCCCGGGGGPDPQFARWSLWLDEAIGFKQAVVWDKGALGMGWHYRRNYELILVAQKPGMPCKWNGGLTTSNVLRIPKIIPASWQHPTPKPVELMEKFAHLHADAGDLVLDPLIGAGTTAIACKRLSMRCIGVEIEERYCEIAANRLAQGVFEWKSA